MAKRIQVGGRIESNEVGGIVTGAAEILDDAKGKKQSVINGETDDELLRLDQSKQDNLTFDNAPTEGSDNPVKSGGLYTAQQAILLAIAAINELIPSAASTLNQLADKAFVNSSISTNTATFRGTSADGLNEQQFLAWANGLEHDLNDYVFWQTSDAAGNTLFKRYKWNGTEWRYEYTLNNSTFTAEQWEAIQSGITALLVAKLRALPTAQELIQSFDSKQDVLTFDDVPTLGSTNPVKSSGIYNVIKAITDLVPAEATAQNQLADKADVAAKILAAIPSWKGQYDALTDLQAVTGAKAGDMGCVKTTDSDGHAVLTFYQYSAQGAWVVYYTLRHYAQNKPATTGTTGDYPFNGMGRIELQKNIVNGVNTLTQAMLTQQNTIYVIQYDFTLASDVTIPANCVLEFDGGSISGNNIDLNGGEIKASDDVYIFKSCNITNYSNVAVLIAWFGVFPSQENQSSLINDVIANLDDFKVLQFGYGTYVANIRAWRSNITIEGKGIGSTIIKCPNGSNLNVFDLGNEADFSDFSQLVGRHHLNVRNLEIDGNRLNIPECTKDTFGHGLITTLVQESIFENLYIHDCRMTGMDICINSNRNVIQNIWIDKIASDLQYPSLDVNASDYIFFNNIIIYDAINGFSGRGFRLLGCHNCIANVIVMGCKGTAIEINTNTGPTVSNNYVNAVVKNSKRGLGMGSERADGCFANEVHLNIDSSGDATTSESLIKITGNATQNLISIISSNNKGNLLECLGSNNKFILQSIGDGVDSIYSDYKWAVVLREGANNNDIDADIITTTLHGFAISGSGNRINFSYKNAERTSTEFTNDADNVYVNKDIPKIGTSLPQYMIPKGTLFTIINNSVSYPIVYDGSKWKDGTGRIYGQTKGVTRPTLTSSDIGYMFFDTSLTPARPIYWNGTDWVDATGATV